MASYTSDDSHWFVVTSSTICHGHVKIHCVGYWPKMLFLICNKLMDSLFYQCVLAPQDFREDFYEQVPNRHPAHKGPHHAINPGSKTGQDLISALLDRGTKLRDAMVVSEVQPRERRKSGTDTECVGPPEREPTMLRYAMDYCFI